MNIIKSMAGPRRAAEPAGECSPVRGTRHLATGRIGNYAKSPMLAALMACSLLGSAPIASADAVTDWNEIAVAAVSAGRPGPISQFDLAVVQLAVHDAIQAIDRRYEPYYAEVPGATGSRAAAATAAAYGVLAAFYPAQAGALTTQYDTYVATNGLTGDPGLAVGQQVAAKAATLRRNNPNLLPAPYVGNNSVGQWRPTPSFLGGPPATLSPMFSPWMATFEPFGLTGPARFRAPPPPDLNSERYRKDYDEVKAFGAFNSTARSPQQTDIAYFYSDNFTAQFNRALRAIASQRLGRIGDSGRLFALVNMAMADAIIMSWDSKVHYNFWRPVTAIQEGNNDGNPLTVGDPSWQPLINTPNYPDYTSGANNLSGAFTRTLTLFFNTDWLTFDVTSNAALAVQKTRTYHRFSDLARDIVNARIYLGIHFRFADTAARTQGERTASWNFDRYLCPIGFQGHDFAARAGEY